MKQPKPFANITRKYNTDLLTNEMLSPKVVGAVVAMADELYAKLHTRINTQFARRT